MRYVQFKIVEMAALSKSDDVKYVPFVQQMLDKAPEPIRIGKSGDKVLIPNKGQKVTDRNDPIYGQVDGEDVTNVKVMHVWKTPAMKAGVKGQEVDDTGAVDKIENKGEVVEGILGAATHARLSKGDEITPEEVYTTIGKMKHGKVQGTLSEKAKDLKNNKITDLFELSISLKERAYQDFMQPDKLRKHMAPRVNAVTAYVNDAVRRYSKFFLENGRSDKVEVVSDGVSNEVGSKTDVQMIYTDAKGKRVVKHFDLSVKTGDVGQFGQKGGGKGKASLDERFDLMQDMYNKFGLDISGVKSKFVEKEDIVSAYKEAYSHAADVLDKKLKGANLQKESEVLRQLITGLKFFGTLGDDRIRLVDFSDKGYYVLDFKRLSKLYLNADIDLGARVEYSKRDKGVGKPTLVIYNKLETKKTKQKLFQVRMYMDDTGYVRNYIEKGDLLKVLTKVRGNY